MTDDLTHFGHDRCHIFRLQKCILRMRVRRALTQTPKEFARICVCVCRYIDSVVGGPVLDASMACEEVWITKSSDLTAKLECIRVDENARKRRKQQSLIQASLGPFRRTFESHRTDTKSSWFGICFGVRTPWKFIDMQRVIHANTSILLNPVAGPMICGPLKVQIHAGTHSKRSNFCFIEINNNNHFKRTHKFNYRNFYCGENEIHFTFLRFVSPEIYSPTLSASLNRLVSVDAQANTDCIESRYRFFVLAPARQRHQLECDWQWSENKEMRIESRQLQPFACKIYIKFSHKNVHYSESAEPIISTCACPLPTAY